MTYRLEIKVDTYVRGEPVAAGEIIEVPGEDAGRLLPYFANVLPPDEAAPEVATPAADPEAVESADPEPEHRDPQPKRSHHAKK